MREVADHLGNTPAVARSAYVDPRVVDLYADGITIAPTPADLDDWPGGDRDTKEAAVLDLLRTRTNYR
jgi:DNA topoisomerase IB